MRLPSEVTTSRRNALSDCKHWELGLEVRAGTFRGPDAVFALTLLSGTPVAGAYAAAVAEAGPFDPADAFRRLLGLGAFAGAAPSPPPGDPR